MNAPHNIGLLDVIAAKPANIDVTAGSAFVETARSLVNDYDAADAMSGNPRTHAYWMGGIEAEAVYSFAAAVHGNNAYMLIEALKKEVLLKLGLAGDNGPHSLSIEQERLRGWLCSIFGSLAGAIESAED